MTLDEAQKLVLQKINDPVAYPGAAQNPLAISKIVTKSNGWVFFYDAIKAIETGDWQQYSMVGNVPLFVNDDGTITYIPDPNDPLRSE